MNEKEIRRKIGQVVFCGFFGTDLNDDLKEMIDKYYVGNVIYFSRNYLNSKQMLQMNKDLYAYVLNKTGCIPFTAIDQEGGNVTRLMNGVTFPPSPLSTSKTSIEDACYKVGKIIGRDMISLGLNLNLAPCLDINSQNPFYKNIRRYGDTPDEVSVKAKRFMDGIKEYGVLSCMKHFPGAGEDTVDTHFDKCELRRTLKEIENHELIPFIDNIDEPCIMTTHTTFKEIDSLPSTLSEKVIKGYLRGKLNYKGIVITDALEMNAINDYYGAVKASLMSLKAGADMILCCHDRDIQIQTFEYLYKCVEEGLLLESELDEKIERITKAKDGLGKYLDKYFYNNLAYVRDEDSVRLSYDIVKASYEIIKGDKIRVTKNTLFLAPELYAINGAEDVFDDRSMPKSLKLNFKNDVVVLDNKKETKDLILKSLDKYDSVVAFSYNVNIDKVNLEIINEVNNRIKTYIVSLKGIMDIELYDDLKNYSVLYEYTPNSIKAIIDIMKSN